MASVAFVSSGTDSMALLNHVLSNTTEELEAIFIRFNYIFADKEISYCESKLDSSVEWLKSNVRDFTFTKEDQIAPSWSYYLKPEDRVYGSVLTKEKMTEIETIVSDFMSGMGEKLDLVPLKTWTNVYPSALERMYNYCMFAKRRSADKIYTGHDSTQFSSTLWKVLLDNFWPLICSIPYTAGAELIPGSRLTTKASIPTDLVPIMNDCEMAWTNKQACNQCRRCLVRRILNKSTMSMVELESLYEEILPSFLKETASSAEQKALKELYSRI